MQRKKSLLIPTILVGCAAVILAFFLMLWDNPSILDAIIQRGDTRLAQIQAVSNPPMATPNPLSCGEDGPQSGGTYLFYSTTNQDVVAKGQVCSPGGCSPRDDLHLGLKFEVTVKEARPEYYDFTFEKNGITYTVHRTNVSCK